jgi:hypothetical protein
MIHNTLNPDPPALRRTACRVVRWISVNTALGVVAGATFGSVFGGFAMLLHFEPLVIASSVRYFAACGAIAGAVIGIYGGLVDDAEACEKVSPSPISTSTFARLIEPDRESGVPSQRLSHNRLASVSSSVRRRSEIAATQNPSWN